MEGYYQYSVVVDEGDAIHTYCGVVFSEYGFSSAANRLSNWYKNYGHIQSITVEELEEGSVYNEQVKDFEIK